MATLASFQQITQQGDGKANTLLVIHVGLTAVVATQVAGFHGVPSKGLFALVFWLVAVGYLLSFAIGGYFIAQVIRPRKADVSTDNPLALPDHRSSTPTQALAPSGTAVCATHVWDMAQAVARLAAEKNALIDRAVVGTSVMVVCAMIWSALIAACGR